MSSSKTVRLCLVSWLRSQKSTKPKLCKSLACASSTKSKPLANDWKIFDSLISLVDFSDLKVWYQRWASYKKRPIWCDNNYWECEKKWICRSSSCVAIGQSASLVAPLTCWWPPKPDSTITKETNVVRWHVRMSSINEHPKHPWIVTIWQLKSTNATWAPQPLVNDGRLAAATLRIDPSTRLQRFHATWPATYVEPTNIRAFSYHDLEKQKET